MNVTFAGQQVICFTRFLKAKNSCGMGGDPLGSASAGLVHEVPPILYLTIPERFRQHHRLNCRLLGTICGPLATIHAVIDYCCRPVPTVVRWQPVASCIFSIIIWVQRIQR
jgi:hypothetical protein